MVKLIWFSLLVTLLTAWDKRTDAFQSQSVTTQSNRRIRIESPLLPLAYGHSVRREPSPHGGRSVSATSSRRTALNAVPPSLLALASSPAGAVVVLAGIILIHESGHYLAARSFGMEVEEFSIGFGPKLLGFSSLGNEFNLRLIPLGGYVRFPENYNATEYEELRKQAYESALAQKKLSKQPKPTLGFRIANALTLGSLERKSKEAEERAAEERVDAYNKLPWWGKLKAIQNKQAEENELDVEEVQVPYDDNPDLLQNRPWPQRAVVISAGVIFNLLLSFFIYFGEIGGPTGLPSPVFEPGVKIGAIPRENAAAKGILQAGDVILQANGMPVTKSVSPSVLEAQKGMDDLINTIRATPDGQQVELSILRAGGDYAETVLLQPERAMRPGDADASGPQTIGVLLTPNNVGNKILKTSDPVEAARLAFDYTYRLTSDTAQGVTQALSQFVTPSGGKSGGGGGGSVSGPIGLIRTGSEVVATQDVQTVLLFAAAISINLGVVNALPLPVLDGGQLLFVLAEAITRRKVDQRVQEGIQGFAALFLLFLTVSATVGDISSIFGL